VRFVDLGPKYFTVGTDNEAELHVAAAGPENGPLVVLARCWTGTHEFWGPVATTLVDDGCRVVAYDPRGHGRSSTGGDSISIDRLGSDLVAVLDQVATLGAVLVGHSMGGMAIQAAVVGHPRILEDLVGIVLVSTSARPTALRVPGAVADRLVGESASARMARRSPASSGQAFGPGATTEQLEAVHDATAATPGTTRVPTRVAVGSHDRLAPPAKSRQLTDLIPGAQMSFLDGAGHMVPLGSPAAVVAAVRSLDTTIAPVRNFS
jgi:pimeloyl-ACP methyl ester carboxylesterase